MSKLSAIIAGVAVLPVLAFASPVSAADYYSNIGGGNIFQVKNLSAAGQYNDPANATCGQTVRFRLFLHNAGPAVASDVSVKVAFPTDQATSFGVKATVIDANADPSFPAIADTATVKTDKTASIKYVAGSAEYFDRNGGRLGAMSDTIATTGASLPGGVAVSLNNERYVALNAVIACETTPPVVKIQVCELATKKIVTINETDFNSTTYTKDLTKCNSTPVTPITSVTPTTPTTLVKTGPGDVAALFAGVTVLAAVAYRIVLRRQNAR